MRICRSDSDWEVRAPAKVNLWFEVFARRDDGFHEIETLMVPIGLYDTLYFRSQPTDQIRFECQWAAGCQAGVAGWGEVPSGPDNLAVRAVTLLAARAGVRAGAKMRLVKRIPAAAGLGGGSSDAAAALTVANRAWQLNWPRARLAELAAELGSDIPFFLGSGAAVCGGRGERVRAVVGVGLLHLVVVKPPAGLATARVYRACRPTARPPLAGPMVGVAPMLAALRCGDLGRVGQLLHNRLQPAAERLSDWIRKLREAFAQVDCVGFQMSGSGTACFGICRTARQAHRVAATLRSRAIGSVFQVDSCP